jgi:hypothetical protein
MLNGNYAFATACRIQCCMLRQKPLSLCLQYRKQWGFDDDRTIESIQSIKRLVWNQVQYWPASQQASLASCLRHRIGHQGTTRPQKRRESICVVSANTISHQNKTTKPSLSLHTSTNHQPSLKYSVTRACFICASIIRAFNPLWSESEVSKHLFHDMNLQRMQ